ncbi:hypothetical protein B5E64_06155 [Drancourtella sp. An12]|nr:hypothetical protein B5E64_06155 [Drancourtella sp. An12]
MVDRHILNFAKKFRVKDCAYNMPILEMKILGQNLEINEFVRVVRKNTGQPYSRTNGLSET